MKQFSVHEIRVYEAVREHGGWQTAKQVAAAADVADRTARHHCRGLTDAGLFEERKVFGGHRYRLRAALDESAERYAAALEQAKKVLE